MPLPRASACLVLLGGALGCASSGALAAAEAGNRAALAKALEAELASGDLDDARARAVALAVGEGEIERAKGGTGAARVRELAVCGKPLDDALERRARELDEVAAIAALARLEANASGAEELARNAPSGGGASGAWRAVSARALRSTADGAARRELVKDGDEDVRLAALRAAIDAADTQDVDAVLEAARLDPSPLGRTLGIRAAGAIGGERVVLALKDAWPLADEGSRHAIADAWATPRSLDHGGRRELSWAAETQTGAPAIAAAHALARTPGPGADTGLAVLVRAMGSSNLPRDRIYALRVAPLTAGARARVLELVGDDDEDVALAAEARLLETPESAGGAAPGSAERRSAVTKLLAAAAATNGRAASAKAALARAGVAEVRPFLTKDLGSADARLRAAAASGLWALGDPRAALATADAEPAVRTTAVCAILAPR